MCDCENGRWSVALHKKPLCPVVSKRLLRYASGVFEVRKQSAYTLPPKCLWFACKVFVLCFRSASTKFLETLYVESYASVENGDSRHSNRTLRSEASGQCKHSVREVSTNGERWG